MYTGEFAKGKRHGSGVAEEVNGPRYEGEFQDEKCCGLGVLTVRGRICARGMFKNGMLHGPGVREIEDGHVAVGEFYKWAQHGYGKQIRDGGSREGQWKHEELHGLGRVASQAGDYIYQGSFEEDKMHGVGDEFREGVWIRSIRGTFFRERHEVVHGGAVVLWSGV